MKPKRTITFYACSSQEPLGRTTSLSDIANIVEIVGICFAILFGIVFGVIQLMQHRTQRCDLAILECARWANASAAKVRSGPYVRSIANWCARDDDSHGSGARLDDQVQRE